jgi:hypothetical protein
MGERAGMSVVRSIRLSTGICGESLTSSSRSRSSLERRDVSLDCREGQRPCSLVVLLQPFGSLHSFSLLVEVIIAFGHHIIELDSHLPILLSGGTHVSCAQGCCP